MNTNEQKMIAEKIRAQYVENRTTPLDELRTLDKNVKKPANVFGYIFGGIAAIVMGCGMSLVMTDVGTWFNLGSTQTNVIGIVTGVIGMIMAIVNYPLYKKILDGRKKKFANRIVELSNSIAGK